MQRPRRRAGTRALGGGRRCSGGGGGGGEDEGACGARRVEEERVCYAQLKETGLQLAGGVGKVRVAIVLQPWVACRCARGRHVGWTRKLVDGWAKAIATAVTSHIVQHARIFPNSSSRIRGSEPSSTKRHQRAMHMTHAAVPKKHMKLCTFSGLLRSVFHVSGMRRVMHRGA